MGVITMHVKSCVDHSLGAGNCTARSHARSHAIKAQPCFFSAGARPVIVDDSLVSTDQWVVTRHLESPLFPSAVVQAGLRQVRRVESRGEERVDRGLVGVRDGAVTYTQQPRSGNTMSKGLAALCGL